MSKPKGSLRRNWQLVLLVIVIAAVVYFVVSNLHTFWNILLVLLGFGAVVLVHEFGHFVVAKLSDIKVEAFSIGFPPTLCGILRTEEGYRIRILPDLFRKEGDESGEGRLSFSVGKKAGAGETEYRIGLIPFGGFVKMLGQDDIGSVEASDDPRSFTNKPVGVRMGVIAAGVLFNAISAVVIFMVVFLVGIRLMPPVVGAVRANSPAARAGLKAGDEVIEIAGDSDNLDFSSIKMASALSDLDEEVELKVRHTDGSVEDFSLVAEQVPGERLRSFGIFVPLSLTIARLSESGANGLFERTGLKPADRIKSVNGRDVLTHWELEEIVRNSLVPEVTLLAERTDPVSKKLETIESRIGLSFSYANTYDVESESELSHIYTMVPRLRITSVSTACEAQPSLEAGDIVLAIGDVVNPTYKEIRDVTEEYEDKELPVSVLRADANGVEQVVSVTVVPRCPRGVDRVMIGIGVALDAAHPVVAKTIAAEGGPARLDIARGAVITAVDGVGVSDFYDVIREIRANAGRRITIEYRLDKEIAGGVALDIDSAGEFVTVKSAFAVPFEDLKRLYKASGPIDAIGMGYKKTVMFIAQTYVTLKLLVGGLVSVKDLTGPVGIITLSYQIVARQPVVYYVYFLGLISACIAVFNFLPLPPLDGGLAAFLLVEKVKGSALSQRVQEVIVYAGWVLIGSLLLYVTFKDVRNLFS